MHDQPALHPILRDVHELNLHYLTAAWGALRQDRVQAMSSFRLTAAAADQLEAMTLQDLKRAAAIDVVISVMPELETVLVAARSAPSSTDLNKWVAIYA